MWRKSEDSRLKSSSDSPSSPDASGRTSGVASPNSPGAPATVSQRIKIKGEITGEGDFSVDGEFEGTVHLADGRFTVGPNARVTAQIEAREIIVRGEVIGSLKAHDRVHIWSTGKLTGDLDSRGIMIEDGAELHSKVAVPQTRPQPSALQAATPEALPQEAPAPQPSLLEASSRTKAATAGAATLTPPTLKNS
jgi:cytoskeletal protein CcmA (bactofilin family)